MMMMSKREQSKQNSSQHQEFDKGKKSLMKEDVQDPKIEVQKKVNEHIKSLCKKLNIPMTQEFKLNSKSYALKDENALIKKLKKYLISRYEEIITIIKTGCYKSEELGEIKEQFRIIEEIIMNNLEKPKESKEINNKGPLHSTVILD